MINVRAWWQSGDWNVQLLHVVSNECTGQQLSGRDCFGNEIFGFASTTVYERIFTVLFD